jgi:glycosyltransferase involved in cell wall biosynthesis
VVWDGRVVYGPELRGIGTYSANLVTEMRRLRPDVEHVVLTDEATAHPDRIQGITPRVVGPTRGYRWHFWEQYGLPWHATRLRADILHCPANTAPIVGPVPRVITVHDVIPYMADVADFTLTGRYWRATVPSAIRRAAAIVTVSELSRNDIMRVMKVPGDRIRVIPNAAGSDVVPVPEPAVASVLAKYDIQAPYVLSLAAPARRKNTLGVVEIFSHVARRIGDVQLVLIGVGSTFREKVTDAARSFGISDHRLRLIEFVDPHVRNALYSGAAVFLFLSLYEGFGIPILEAMRCGAPVLCSTRASCPEVAGDAAVLVDPTDIRAAADALVQMLRAPGLQREEWRHRGRTHERTFTWRRAAAMTLQVYDTVA